MELLVLILAIFIRALLLQPKSWSGARQIINDKVNHLLKSNNVYLVTFILVTLLVGYVLHILFGRDFMDVLETVGFIYLFYIMYRDFPVITDETEVDRVYLMGKMCAYDDDFEDNGESIEKLRERLFQAVVENYFTSTLVLTFWFLSAGWVGLVLYFFMYYLRFNNAPTWLLSVKYLFEIPVGVLGSASCAIAGRMDNVLAELLSQRFININMGLRVFETAVRASTNMSFEVGSFHKNFTSCKNLCLRSMYVWLFVVALAFIVM